MPNPVSLDRDRQQDAEPLRTGAPSVTGVVPDMTKYADADGKDMDGKDGWASIDGAHLVEEGYYTVGDFIGMLLGINVMTDSDLALERGVNIPSRAPKNAPKLAPFHGKKAIDLSKIATHDPRIASLAEVATATVTIEIHPDHSADAKMSIHFKDKASEKKFRTPAIWKAIGGTVEHGRVFLDMWFEQHPQPPKAT